MPVEIRELVVKATVRPDTSDKQALAPKREAAKPANERALLRNVMRVLEDKRER